MAIYTAFLASIEKIWFKPFETTNVNTVFVKLSYKNTVVIGVKGFFEINEDYTINKAIVNVDRSAICGFDQRSKRTVQWSESRQTMG